MSAGGGLMALRTRPSFPAGGPPPPCPPPLSPPPTLPQCGGEAYLRLVVLCCWGKSIGCKEWSRSVLTEGRCCGSFYAQPRIKLVSPECFNGRGAKRSLGLIVSWCLGDWRKPDLSDGTRHQETGISIHQTVSNKQAFQYKSCAAAKFRERWQKS